jgi:hypothetical protein
MTGTIVTIFQIELDEPRLSALQMLAKQTGKTQKQLVSEALDRLLDNSDAVDWRSALNQPHGIWQDRQDIPDLGELRSE